ncbi:MAG: hypothetical protein LBV38_08000 [Alistipes sp.]|jgi:hypothetical protein|nr:hypothetical protein [Alistipes sp.]
MKVIFIPEVRLYLQELEHILYYNHYFDSNDSARKYVMELWGDIVTYLPAMVAKTAPPSFNRFGMGMHYATFRKNKQTSWYVFFTEYEVEGEIVFLIRHITNNHVIAQYL